MRNSQLRRFALLGTAVASGLAVGLSGQSASAQTASFKFATDQPGRPGDDNSSVEGAAGVLGSSTWNNTAGDTGTVTDAATGITVTWDGSAGNWSSTGRGEENNTADGENGDLMAGYLDTTATDATVINVTGLNPATSYNVVVYHNGGVIGRGGDYTISGAAAGNATQSYVDSAAFTGTFVAEEDFQTFANVSGDGFTLTATPTVGNPARAPVNAIEITVVPEPAALGLLGLGALGLLARRRRA